MSDYAYFPGCTLESSNVGYGACTREVCRSLGVNLIDIGDWNCCSAGHDVAALDLGSYCTAARNLALAAHAAPARDMVAACSLCYVRLCRAEERMRDHPNLKAAVDSVLAAGGIRYAGGVRVRHLLDVLSRLDPETIKARVKRPLNGLRVAAYYGCQALRPFGGFDDPLAPTSLQRLVQATGASATDFQLQNACCGGTLIMFEEEPSLEFMARLLDSARRSGASCIVCVCPLCQLNLDAYQAHMAKQSGHGSEMPVLYFTQLLGLALDMSAEAVGLKKNAVPAERMLAGRR